MNISDRFNNSTYNIIVHSYRFAKKRHRGQLRKYTNEDYISHPLAVAEIVEQIKNNCKMTSAALLHDVVEDTDTTIEEVSSKFGTQVASLVRELTNDENEKQRLSKKIYLTQKMNAMSSDAFTIKLADRLHNVTYLRRRKTPINFIESYHKETIHILDNLDRCLFEEHKILIEMLKSELSYLRLIHNLLS